MASPAYMTVYDENGLALHGNVKILDRQNTVEVLAFDHEVYIPTDQDTGSLTSTRKHDPFIITKSFGPLSPDLYKACCDGKTLQRITLDWYKVDNNGKERKYFSHRLDNVKVVSVRPVMRHIKDRKNDHHVHEEQVALRYERITWLYHDGNKQADDSWDAR